MKIINEVNLAPYSTMGIVSRGKIIYFPENKNEFIHLLTSNSQYYILGGGSNTVFAEYVNTPIISTKYINKFNVEKNLLTFQAGVTIASLMKLCRQYNYYNLLFLFGIPGTIGGAIEGNATLFTDRSIFDYLFSLEIFGTNDIEIKQYFAPKYRDGNINGIIIQGKLQLIPDTNKFKNILEKAQKIRMKQPKGKSVGSIFKNPPKYPAGYLIDKCGLKGTKIGDIKISEKHANFFINEGKGTFSDFMKLLEMVKECVFKKFSIELEEEVKIVS